MFYSRWNLAGIFLLCFRIKYYMFLKVSFDEKYRNKANDMLLLQNNLTKEKDHVRHYQKKYLPGIRRRFCY
jgi:hypothetical protein